MKKYQLGDKWSNDFDYDGLIRYCNDADVSWGADKLEKLYDSLVDVNYHDLARDVDKAVEHLRREDEGDMAVAIESLDKVRETIKKDYESDAKSEHEELGEGLSYDKTRFTSKEEAIKEAKKMGLMAQGGEIGYKEKVIKELEELGYFEYNAKELYQKHRDLIDLSDKKSPKAMARSLANTEGHSYAKGGALDKEFKFTKNFVIYVPSTSNVGDTISKSELEKRVKEVEKYVADEFGGYTETETEGGYKSTSGDIIEEDVVKVSVFAQNDDWKKNEGKVVAKVKEWAKKWGQEAIGFEYEGDLYYIDDDGKFTLGGVLMAGIAGYVGYKIGRARPQKKGFETEKAVGRKFGKKFKRKKKMSKGGKTYAEGGEIKNGVYEYIDLKGTRFEKNKGYTIRADKWNDLIEKGVLDSNDINLADDWRTAIKEENWGKYSRLMYSPKLDQLREQTQDEFYNNKLYSKGGSTYAEGGGVKMPLELKIVHELVSLKKSGHLDLSESHLKTIAIQVANKIREVSTGKLKGKGAPLFVAQELYNLKKSGNLDISENNIKIIATKFDRNWYAEGGGVSIDWEIDVYINFEDTGWIETINVVAKDKKEAIKKAKELAIETVSMGNQDEQDATFRVDSIKSSTTNWKRHKDYAEGGSMARGGEIIVTNYYGSKTFNDREEYRFDTIEKAEKKLKELKKQNPNADSDDIFMSMDGFWNREYKHYFRGAGAKKQRKVYDQFTKEGLDPSAVSNRHLEIIEKIIGLNSNYAGGGEIDDLWFVELDISNDETAFIESVVIEADDRKQAILKAKKSFKDNYGGSGTVQDLSIKTYNVTKATDWKPTDVWSRFESEWRTNKSVYDNYSKGGSTYAGGGGVKLSDQDIWWEFAYNDKHGHTRYDWVKTKGLDHSKAEELALEKHGYVTPNSLRRDLDKERDERYNDMLATRKRESNGSTYAEGGEILYDPIEDDEEKGRWIIALEFEDYSKDYHNTIYRNPSIKREKDDPSYKKVWELVEWAKNQTDLIYGQVNYKSKQSYGTQTSTYWANGGKSTYAEGGEIEGYNMDEVVKHFVMAGLWASNDDEGEPLEDSYDADDVSKESYEKIAKGATKFINENKALLKKHNISTESLGHDLFLDSQGHGVGFWDRGYGDDGDTLSKSASKIFASDQPYVGDDKKIYFKKGGSIKSSFFSGELSFLNW